MVNTITTQCAPEEIWQQKALATLEESLGQSLDLWRLRGEVGWSRQSTASNSSEGESLSTYVEQVDSANLIELITSAISVGASQTSEHAAGEHLLAIPLGKRAAATAIVQTDRPELILRLADVGARYLQQQEEIERLREENNFFLKQVSDDFEELTFLRSMAERLGLGDSAHTVEQLVSASLSELGKSAHAEELYFVSRSDSNELSILASWHKEELQWTSNDESTVLRLVEEHRAAAEYQPVIKNGIDPLTSDLDLEGVRDFVLVTVGSELEPVGWFAAINREVEREELDGGKLPEWRLNQHEFGTSEATLLSTAAAMMTSHANNLSLFQEREALLVNVVRALVSAVEAKDQYTCGHSERVALYGKRLAQQVGYDQEACELLYLTGLLHDVGKIAVSDAVLNKPDRLTDAEFEEIQRHPEEGWKILQGLEQLNYVLPGVLHHHERCDGKGYPDKLEGTDIPLDGRILAVADAYDAMTSDRAYRTGMPHEKAIGILQDGAGTQWDAEVVSAFMEIISDITEIRESYRPRVHPNRTPTSVERV